MIGNRIMFGSMARALRSFIFNAGTIRMHTNDIRAWSALTRKFRYLKRIVFTSSNGDITQEHANSFRNQLKNAQTIDFKKKSFTSL